MTQPTPVLDAALRYATAIGWYVFPIGDDSKIPLTPHGYHDATTDPATITAWWTAHPTARIGVACRRSGFIAIDVDPRNGGSETLAALEGTHGPLPRNNLQRSGSDGRHILMADPSPGADGWTRTQDSGGQIRGKLPGGIDLKCNGYIVVEPSGTYEWLALDPHALAPVPDAWIDILKKPAAASLEGEGVDAWATSEDDLSDAEQALLWRMLAEIGPRGAGNNSTYRAVKTIFHGFGLSVDAGAPYLIAWSSNSGTPHTQYELERQITRIAEDVDEYGRGYILGRERLRAWWQSRVPLPPNQPTRDNIEATLRAAASKLTRSSKPAKMVEGKILGRLLKRASTVREDEDAEQALVDAAVVLVKHTPPGTTRMQIVEMLTPCALGSTPDEIAVVVAAAQHHAANVASVVATQLESHAAAATNDAGAPVDDDALRAMLIPAGEEGGAKACGSNLELILRYASDLRGRVRFNALTKQIEITAGIFSGEHANGLDVGIKNWLERAWSLFAPVSNVGEQLLRVARTWGAYDPVAEYLNTLEWDGVPRVDMWLETYCNARTSTDELDISTYVRRVGAMFLISAVARALKPGCKVDTVLVLEGLQGAKKSTALRVLGGAWFSDTPLVLGDKDSRMLATSKWLVELAELSSLKNHSDVEQHKAFLSASTDNFRPPYGRVIEEFDRRCVFAGTTNATEYLHDPSGGRRYWAVYVERIDTDALTRDRDQIWAEAVARYRADERWWFERHEQAAADDVAEERRGENPWTSLMLSWWTTLPPERRKRFSLADAAQMALNIDKKDLKRVDQQVAAALREAGFVKHRERVAGRQSWYWTHGDADSIAPAPTPTLMPTEAPETLTSAEAKGTTLSTFGRLLGTKPAAAA